MVAPKKAKLKVAEADLAVAMTVLFIYVYHTAYTLAMSDTSLQCSASMAIHQTQCMGLYCTCMHYHVIVVCSITCT